MENQKQKKSVGTVLLVILLLIVTIASLILATYAWAKYTSQETGSATAQVAKWDVDVDFSHSNYKEQTFSHVLKQRLAPGTSGHFDITIKPQNTEVDFTYEIILEKVEASNGGSVPKHLHFYTNASHSKDDLIGDITGITDEETGTTAESKLKGTIEVIDPDTKTKKADLQDKTVTIYWEWPYENPDTSSEDSNKDSDGDGITDYDEQDTEDGQKASELTITYKVITKQVNPGE